MRVALDTNVLVYAEGVNGTVRKRETTKLLSDLAESEIVIPVQALGELFAVLTRKAGWSSTQARDAVLDWRRAALAVETSPDILLDAMELTVRHQFAIWDAIMIAAASRTDCDLLLSEDMHHGFVWRNVTIRDPFRNA